MKASLVTALIGDANRERHQENGHRELMIKDNDFVSTEAVIPFRNPRIATPVPSASSAVASVLRVPAEAKKCAPSLIRARKSLLTTLIFYCHIISKCLLPFAKMQTIEATASLDTFPCGEEQYGWTSQSLAR